MRLRSILAATAGALAVALAGSVAQAQQPYPTRPITMIVPFAAGGPTDVLARILAQQMGPSLGAQIVIENVTGAGGTIGSARVAKAAPDGYTMVMGNLGTHGASMGLYKNLSYDPRTDFEPVMLVATTPMVLLVKKDLPVATLGDFIALAKKRRLSMGSAGIGSIAHLTLLLYREPEPHRHPARAVPRSFPGRQRFDRRADRFVVRPGDQRDARTSRPAR